MNMIRGVIPSRAFVLSVVIVSANTALSQQTADEEIDEIVVTGSFIRNSQFTNASPIETITTDEIWESGASNLGEFLRDLPYMENIDIVANTYDFQDGQQDSNSARFNLRGLGTQSTLTLMDGRRSVNAGAVAGLLPSIAQQRVEIVTDGGAALYGADAVAGVANIIPYKEYEGFKVRTYHKRDEPGDTEQSTVELLTGLSFDNGINWVGAFEYRNRTALVTSERPKYLRGADGDSASNTPGTWQRDTQVGFPYSHGYHYFRDPSCGTFNDGHEDIGAPANTPSGIQSATGRSCTAQFGEWSDYGRPSVNYTLFNNFTYSPTDWLDLEFQMSHNYRESQLIFSPSSAPNSANGAALTVPTAHPSNPFGRAVKPYYWRPFAKAGTLPSHLEGSGFNRRDYPYYTDAYKFGGNYRIADTTWEGETWIGYQTYRRRVKAVEISMSRMTAALNGQGGPSGDEWFNPFGSADSRSPEFVSGLAGQGGTENSQSVVDWMHVDNYHQTDQTRLQYIDAIFNGEIMDIPMGTIRGAFGFQIRHIRDWNYNDPLELRGDDISDDPSGFINPIIARDSGVRSAFAEIEIPLLTDSVIGNVGIKAAVRYEDFYTLGYDTTKPKISLLWELNDVVAFRASYGESFLAPSPSQLRQALQEYCTDVPDDDPDPITGLSMEGLPSCTSGNPNLNAEESDIINFGVSFRPIEGLSIDIDYQEIEYFDKIQTLISDEVTSAQYYDFLAATNYTEASYDTSNPAHVADGVAWVLANPNPLVNRFPDGSVEAIIRAPVNYATQFVEGFDVRARYSFDYRDWGRFTVGLSGNYYTEWKYQQSPTTPIVEAIGTSNSNTAFAPPIAEWKGSISMSWFRNNHSASITTRYIDEMIYDETTRAVGFSASDNPYIRAITKTDARYSFRFNIWDTDGNMTAGVTNLFDRDAQRLPQRGGIESRIDDPFGRQYYVSLDFEF